MSKLTVGAFQDISETLEVYWLLGLKRHERQGWQIGAVTKGLLSGELRRWWLPIGFWPYLALGARFEQGELVGFVSRGIVGSAVIANVALGEEIASDCLPEGVYSFGEHSGGIQHLIRYETDQGIVLIPTAELIRFLFIHNKTLACAVMDPGSLQLLHEQQELAGGSQELRLRFTREMPYRLLSRAFVQEFAWLAYDLGARRSWDSVFMKSNGERFISFNPPALLDSRWTFRGVKQRDTWLVLELQHVTGKHLPCDRLLYTHPLMKRKKRLGGVPSEGEIPKPSGAPRIETEYVMASGVDGSKSMRNQQVVDGPAKGAEFDHVVSIERIWREEGGDGGGGKKGRGRQPGPVKEGQRRKRRKVFVSLNGEAPRETLAPIELKLLQAVGWNDLGGVEAMVRTLQILSVLAKEVSISLAICQVKKGRAFSLATRKPRLCLIAVFSFENRLPIVLLDVDRSGNHALATLAMHFCAPTTMLEMEKSIQLMLDSLVDRGGHWDSVQEDGLARTCRCERLPRVLPNRDNESDSYLTQWAVRLSRRLNIPIELNASPTGEVPDWS